MFERIVGYDAEKAELAKFCDAIINMNYYKSLGVKIPKGIILHGDPGVGKTTFADSIIEVCGRPSFYLRKNADTAAFIKNMNEAFEQAKNNMPSIIVLDDMDKYGNGQPYAQEYTALQGIMDEYKNYDIFIIATANELYKMPTSLYRYGRFDQIFEIHDPDDNDSASITKYYLSNKNIDPNANLDIISEMLKGSSCATLEVVVNTAALYAAYDRSSMIMMNHLVEAVMNIIYNKPKRIDNRSNDEKYAAAIKAAGRIVITELVSPGTTIFSTIRETQYTTNLQEGNSPVRLSNDRLYFDMFKSDKTFNDNLANILIGLSSKVAYEIKFGMYDIHSAPDMTAVSEVANIIVNAINNSYTAIHSQYEININNTTSNILSAMNDFSDTEDPECDSGKVIPTPKNNQEPKKTLPEYMTTDKLLSEGYEQVKSMLCSKWYLVESFAQRLLQNDIILEDEIMYMMNQYMNTPGFCNLIQR